MGGAPRLRLLAGALAHVDLWPRPGEAVPGWRLRLPGYGLCHGRSVMMWS
jgi:hypothetical protein